MNMYKIRCKKTGLYSTGGMTPRFTKKGKVWTKKGDLIAHLRLVADYYEDKLKYTRTYTANINQVLAVIEALKNYLHNTEVVVLTVVESDTCDTVAMVPSHSTQALDKLTPSEVE